MTIDWLTEPFEYRFMRHALVAALVVGVLSPAVGVWIVLRRLAYLGDAMSHATLAGVATAYLVGVSITVGALGAGIAMGLVMAVLASHPRLAQDAIIGIVETGLFALGVLLITRSDRIGVDLSHFLFGQITTVTRGDLVVNVAMAVAALAMLVVLFGDLRMATFDPEHAQQVGVRVTLLRFVLLVALSVTVVVSLQTVGLLMSIAMLIVPAASARMLTSRVTTMTLVAVAFGVVAAAGGLLLSYHLASAPGATIALVAVAVCLVTFGVTLPRRVRHG
jgi:ABC-type Mn2+/Zn2+ transport system permease subunit